MNLIIASYAAGQKEAEKKVKIPVSVIQVSLSLIPKKIKDDMTKEGIDLAMLKDIAQKKGLKGTLIEIEDASKKLVISID
ncbi:hypothetical protein PITCH_A980030 [uncultured Desulfobacterium sp.]|uniref:Uncharacterized protein n=1 Tax=uncultured Desulfobacterium sp. TaxID=201089 RepID=A0A445N499_9BACT|nr:hypothetical protein PITCH_A980030 [uncultured Desulfobacterium sp.]